MCDDERFSAVRARADDGLPAARVAPAFAEFAVKAACSVFDDRGDATVERLRGEGGLPLRGGKRGDVAGEAHASEEGRGQAVNEPVVGIGRLQHRPDLALTREQEAVEIGRDDGNLDEFVRVGKGRHRGACEHRGLEAMSAR